MSNAIVDKIIGGFDNTEDLKEYCSSQYTTIITQSKKIHEQDKRIETLEAKLVASEQKANIASALSVDQVEGNTDAETICIVQLAILKGVAMSRELVLEECKKAEIFTKILMLLKGKTVSDETKKKETSRKLTTEELLSLASSLTEN